MTHTPNRFDSAMPTVRDPGEYVGRHRLGPNWVYIHDKDDPTIEFRINLNGGAFK